MLEARQNRVPREARLGPRQAALVPEQPVAEGGLPLRSSKPWSKPWSKPGVIPQLLRVDFPCAAVDPVAT